MHYHYRNDNWQTRMKAATFVGLLMIGLVVLIMMSGCAFNFEKYNPLDGPAPAEMSEEQCAAEHPEMHGQGSEKPADKAVHLVQCPDIPNVYGQVPVIEEIMPNGLIYRAYDLNGDKKVDHAQAHVVNITPTPNEGNKFDVAKFPLFYEIDDNGDGSPDRVMVDKIGQGKCEDIVLYMDLTKPNQQDYRENGAGI